MCVSYVLLQNVFEGRLHAVCVCVCVCVRACVCACVRACLSVRSHLIGLPPSIPPFSVKAMFIDLCSLNSKKANLHVYGD